MALLFLGDTIVYPYWRLSESAAALSSGEFWRVLGVGGISQGEALLFHVSVYRLPLQILPGGHDMGLDSGLAGPRPPRGAMGTHWPHVVMGVAENGYLVRRVIALTAAKSTAVDVVRGQFVDPGFTTTPVDPLASVYRFLDEL